ncbi:6-phosphofructokinase, alpha subunit [Mucor velutinosus]|uniref:6-phosphofructokinase, alpha subunit n=1 Tax=Mucor velutinosus TaxID=708070 RepID=A0AAN7D2P5_9FUNG|nr:6-phosphofructokinase, alpha subunit [Mucor velutinosus]
MPIKTLIHNLKLLGFDESKHGKGIIELDEKLFTHRATSNDKAMEYICLFLFRKIDRLRVKKQLLPTLTVHTYASKLKFITNVYKWLLEIRQNTHLFNGVPIRKSELSAYQGVNLIKIMVTFSTFVLESTMKHTDVGKISTLPKATIQNNIVQANQSFDLNTETNNTFTSKATKAAKEISAELSSSPPPPPPPSPPPLQNIISVESQKIRQLNDHFESILHNLHSMVSNSVNQESNAVEEPFTSDSYEHSSGSISFESSRALEESSTLTHIKQPRNVEETSSPVIPEYPGAVNESPNTVSVEQPPNVEESSIPVVPDHPDTLNGPSSSLFAEQPTSVEESTSSVHVDESNTVTILSGTSLFSAAATSSVTAEALSVNAATSKTSSHEFNTAEPEVPNNSAASTKGPADNIYVQEGSTKVATPNYIPRPLTPDPLRDVPDTPHEVSQPKPQATMTNTTFTPRHTSFTTRNTMNYISTPVVVAPMQFNYMTDSCQLPHIRNTMLRHLHNPLLDSPYWYLPPISQADSNQPPPPSPSTVSASPPSPSVKRKFEQEDVQDITVAPFSPPRQKRRFLYSDYDEGAATPTTYDMDLVPPLMDEAAPFRRIYNTEYFDIDFMTPRR